MKHTCSVVITINNYWMEMLILYYITMSITLNCFALNGHKMMLNYEYAFVGYNEDWGSPHSSLRLCHFFRQKKKMHHHVD